MVSPSLMTCCVLVDRRERTLAGATVAVHSLLKSATFTRWPELSALALAALGMAYMVCTQRWRSSVAGLTRPSRIRTPVLSSATNYIDCLIQSIKKKNDQTVKDKDTTAIFCN